MPRGGRREGAGRKPKRPSDKQLGVRPVTTRTVAPPSTNGVSPIEEFDAPDDLTADERAVWLKQAPHAFKNGTLTRGTALSFERYCKVVVLERNEAKSSGMGGANHRGLLKQINSYELQFMLTPCGKPLVAASAPAAVEDEDEMFFGGPRGVVGGREA
jgi:hypothetical protein